MIVIGAPLWADVAATLGMYSAVFFAIIGFSELVKRRKMARRQKKQTS